LVGNNEANYSTFYSYPQKELGNLSNLYPGSNGRVGVATLKLKDLRLKQIDYLKMDIEGAEKELFEQLLSNELADVKQLCVEIHKNTDKDRVIKILRDNDFLIKEMPRSELYAYRPLGWRHHYEGRGLWPETGIIGGNDYSQKWNIEWFKENVFKYIKPGKNVLDVGCGNGRMTILFPWYFKHYTGIDIFEYGGTLCGRYTEYIIGEFEEQEFKHKFDCICFFAVLYEMDNRIDVMKKAKELLNPGGQIIVMDGSQRQITELIEEGWSYNLEKICEQVGLTCKKVEEKDNVFVKICELQ
jgi:hypothetical protein